jgi:hypothetical protein
VDVLIESTKSFEQDLGSLSEDDKAATVKKINDCATLFPTQKADVYRQLRRLPLTSDLNGYESSLYILKVSPKLRAILTVDEDPIFEQVIFTLFRSVKLDELDRAYKSVAESLYRELVPHHRKSA